MMHDDVQSELLDAEFRQILYIIKPLINHINDHYHLERYRVWLERLSTAHAAEKLERNKYLLELANQIHDNTLKFPFTHNPPKGLLPNLQILKKVPSKADPARRSEPVFQNKAPTEWPYVSPRVSCNIQENVKQGVSSKESASSCDKKKNSKAKPALPFQTLGKTESNLKSDTTSWSDLTDTGSTTQAGDVGEENVKNLDKEHKEEGGNIKQHFVNKFSGNSLVTKPSRSGSQKSQSFVKKYSEDTVSTRPSADNSRKIEEESSVKKSSGSTTSKESSNLGFVEVSEKRSKGRRPTEEEVEALKMRMRDLLDVKNALIDTHCLTEDRKKAIETLQEKLIEVQRENAELKTRLEAQEKRKKLKLTHVEQENLELQSLLEAQQKKFMELDQVKSKEMAAYKEKFTVLRQKEIEYLKQYHKNEISTLEKAHAERVSELMAQIESLEKSSEDTIKQLTETNLALFKQKDEEIQRLQNELKERANQPPSEGNGEVNELKRCIAKLEKVLHKSDKEYVKKIDKLKQELEVKDMTTQVQLQTQRADLILRNATLKQDEMRTALNTLEGKYKKMMETLQMQASDMKKHDEQVIDDLKNILKRHNISFENWDEGRVRP